MSAYPVRPNAITRITFYMVYGNDFMVGCGKGDFSNIPNNSIGVLPNTIAYHLYSGQKCQGGDYNVYATPAATGDTVTMIVDLRPFKGRLSFEKNGRDLDTAYLGLNYWGDIYLMFSIWQIGHRIKVIKYEVTE